MKNDIPEQTTIKLPNLLRSALKSLLNGTPPDYSLDDLLLLVITKGIASLVKEHELRGISEEIHEKAEESLHKGDRSSNGQRVAADYVGCHLTADQDAALTELEKRFPLAEEDELLRILLDAGLRALPDDPIARRRLDAVGSWPAEGGSS